MSRASIDLVVALLVSSLAGSCADVPDSAEAPLAPLDAGDCGPGQLPMHGGGCLAAGIPEDGCAPGFVHDGDAGCNAVVPDSACPDGSMAVPGEATCREIAPCGDPPWGEGADDPGSTFVDGAYGGGDSDGTQAKPWTTIQDGVDAAPSGGLVAVAAGSYTEAILIEGKPVVIQGRCPALVEVVGPLGAFAALDVRTGAEGTRLRRLAIRGATTGVALSGSEDVAIEQAWIHGNADRGVNLQDDLGATGIAIAASLLERNRDLGVFSAGSDLSVEATVVRTTEPGALGARGRGLHIEGRDDGDGPTRVDVRSSVIELNLDVGVSAMAAELHVEATVIRETAPREGDPRTGFGVVISDHPTTGARAPAAITGSVVERNHNAGIVAFGSELSVETTVVRGTRPGSDGRRGLGLELSGDPKSLQQSSATMRQCLVEDNAELGILVAGGIATLEAVFVRDTAATADGRYGRAIGVQSDPLTQAPANATISRSRLSRSFDVGLFVGNDSKVTVDASAVEDTQPRPLDGLFGDGIGAQSSPLRASVVVTASLVARSARAGVTSFAAEMTLGATALECNPIHLNGEALQAGEFTFTDLGGNTCGCNAKPAQCLLQSSALQAPEPIAF